MKTYMLVFGVIASAALLDAKYFGCYVDRNNRDLAAAFIDLGSNNAVHTCQAWCTSKAYKYAGTQHRTQCFCDDSFGKYNKVADSQCDDKCPKEQQQSCGGTWRNSVYDTNYLGCWRDSPTRSLPVFTQMGATASVERCLDICTTKGYKYAGVQYATQCFCGNDFDQYGEVNRSECSSTCRGNSSQKCGGIWRNSVYRTRA